MEGNNVKGQMESIIKSLVKVFVLGFITGTAHSEELFDMCREIRKSFTSNSFIEIRFDTRNFTSLNDYPLTCSCRLRTAEGSPLTFGQSIYFANTGALEGGRGKFRQAYCNSSRSCEEELHDTNRTYNVNNVHSVQYTLLQHAQYGSDYIDGAVILSGFRNGLTIILECNAQSQTTQAPTTISSATERPSASQTPPVPMPTTVSLTPQSPVITSQSLNNPADVTSPSVHTNEHLTPSPAPIRTSTERDITSSTSVGPFSTSVSGNPTTCDTANSGQQQTTISGVKQNQSDDEEEQPTAVIAAVAGVVAVLILCTVIVTAVLCYRKRRKNENRPNTNPETMDCRVHYTADPTMQQRAPSHIDHYTVDQAIQQRSSLNKSGENQNVMPEYAIVNKSSKKKRNPEKENPINTAEAPMYAVVNKPSKKKPITSKPEQNPQNVEYSYTRQIGEAMEINHQSNGDVKKANDAFLFLNNPIYSSDFQLEGDARKSQNEEMFENAPKTDMTENEIYDTGEEGGAFSSGDVPYTRHDVTGDNFAMEDNEIYE